jgi:hypothetical protein
VASATTTYAAGEITATGYTLTAAGSALAGAGAGFAGTYVGTEGNFQASLRAGLVGLIFGGIDGYYGDTENLQRVAAKSVAGGISSRLQGRPFEDGFWTSGVTSAARYIYKTWVGDDVTPQPGENRPSQPRYTPDPVTGRQSPSDANMNVLTLNRDLDRKEPFLNAITQNQPLSRALNVIPGANAFARLDDYWYNSRLLPDSGFLYPVSIPVAMIITYTGLIDRASVYLLPAQFSR